jgi:hypothetical protein
LHCGHIFLNTKKTLLITFGKSVDGRR